jgi:hypothetical protein
MSSWRSQLIALALMVGAAFPAWSQNAIQSINSSQQAGSEVLRIELSEALTAVPAGFTVQAPPRVALDLPGVTNGLGKSTVEINQGNLRSVSIAQAGERTRLVLNLKAPAGYRAQLDGKVLIVSLENNAPATLASSSGQTTRFAESLNRTQLSLRDIDFRRGSDGAGRVIVELPNNQVGVDIRQQGQGLVSNSCARACRTTCDVASTSPTSARRCRASRQRSRVTGCAWWSNRAAPGSTAPIRATTSSFSRCAPRRSIRTSSSRAPATRVRSSR